MWQAPISNLHICSPCNRSFDLRSGQVVSLRCSLLKSFHLRSSFWRIRHLLHNEHSLGHDSFLLWGLHFLHLGWALRNPTGWVCWAIVGRSSIWFPRLQRSISFVEWHDSSHCSYGVLFQRPWESPPSPANSRIRFFSYMRNPKKSSEFFSI